MLCHSLNNTSDKIRWSLDLRWQRSDRPVGFYGMKDGVQMRTSQKAKVEIDWDAFNAVTRQEKSDKELHVVGGARVSSMFSLLLWLQQDDEFSTTIAGPWMKKWEITHVNRHVQAMLDAGEGGTQWHGLAG